jgi:hypothetical protein
MYTEWGRKPQRGCQHEHKRQLNKSDSQNCLGFIVSLFRYYRKTAILSKCLLLYSTSGTLNIIIRVRLTHLAAILCEETTRTPTGAAAAATGPAAVPAFPSTAEK